MEELIREIQNKVETLSRRDAEVREIVGRLNAYVNNDDSVLLWGIVAELNDALGMLEE